MNMNKKVIIVLLIGFLFTLFNINAWAITKEEEDKYCNEVIQKLYEDDGDEGQAPSEEAKEGICNSTSGCMWKDSQCISKQWEEENKQRDSMCQNIMPWFYDAYQTEYTNEKDYCEAGGTCSWKKESRTCVGKSIWPNTKLDSGNDSNNGSNGELADRIHSMLDDIPIAENFCSDFASGIKIIGNILLIVRIFVPFLVIGVGTFDVYKSVTGDKPEDLSKNVKMLFIRVLIGVIIIFIPNVVRIAVDMVTTESDYKVCFECLTNPNECKVLN